MTEKKNVLQRCYTVVIATFHPKENINIVPLLQLAGIQCLTCTQMFKSDTGSEFPAVLNAPNPAFANVR